ncbi:MAG TPA: thermonuclease family protein [Pyrinomonadaceae bacterium]|nr:thermonuclease family protein [Pyrinomonadaceae bacterium]
MKITRIFLLLLIVGFAKPAHGTVLRGVVSEVVDGQTISVTVGANRKMTVSLAGVDAPEMGQELGDVARNHLMSLVLNKTVEIELSAIGMSSSMAKVYCNGVDVGLQIIRDGAAWYDPNGNRDLTELEQRLYGEAQAAARNEQRGLWQNGTPMPPWEWRRAEQARAVSTRPPTSKVAGRRGLSSDDLMSVKMPTPSAENKSNAISKNSGTTARLEPKPPSSPLNSPGEDFDFSSYLNKGRVSIAFFYADWCPACRALSPVLTNINRDVPDMQVLFLNIGDWGTPITNRYDITYVPYLRIYDKNGSLIAEGREANSWLQQEFRRRTQP